MKWLILLLGIFANAAASIFMKYAGQGVELPALLHNPFKLFKNYSLLTSVILYFLAFFLYFISLQKLPLSSAHPLMTSGSIVIVTVFSYLLLQEPFAVLKWIGLFFIVIGVWLIAASS